MNSKWQCGCAALAAALGLAAGARGNLIDYNPTTDGAQTASWPEPAMIMVFIPTNLAGADRMNFEMGINSVVECLRRVTVQFKDGEPPDGAMNFIDVNVANTNPPPFGVTAAAPFFPTGQNHGMLDSATITIDPTALGSANFMKNLAAHEFGHALGLEDDPRAGGARMNVMDADFNPDDPFIGLSARDKMMLMMHYQVVPEPSGLVLVWWGTAAIMIARQRRRD